MKEADVKKAVKLIFKKHHVWYFCPAMGQYGRAGIPDFIACCRGGLFAVETKLGKEKPTPLQEMEIDRINAAGGMAVCINEDKLEMLEKLVIKLMERKDANAMPSA